MDADKKLLETVLLIAICHWKLFLTIFFSTFIDSINIFNCRLPGVIIQTSHIQPLYSGNL